MISELSNKEIIRNGKHIFVVRIIEPQQIEDYVVEASRQSLQPMDWLYVGGRACVFVLGDEDKAIEALERIGKERFSNSEYTIYYRVRNDADVLPIDIDS